MTLGIGIGNNLLNNVFMIYLKLNCIAKKANRGLKPRRSFLQRIFKYVFRNLIANPDFEDKFDMLLNGILNMMTSRITCLAERLV